MAEKIRFDSNGKLQSELVGAVEKIDVSQLYLLKIWACSYGYFAYRFFIQHPNFEVHSDARAKIEEQVIKEHIKICKNKLPHSLKDSSRIIPEERTQLHPALFTAQVIEELRSKIS